MSITDANKAANGANKAMKISNTEAISSMREKNGFARPSVNIEDRPLPATVADWIDRDAPEAAARPKPVDAAMRTCRASMTRGIAIQP